MKPCNFFQTYQLQIWSIHAARQVLTYNRTQVIYQQISHYIHDHLLQEVAVIDTLYRAVNKQVILAAYFLGCEEKIKWGNKEVVVEDMKA